MDWQRRAANGPEREHSKGSGARSQGSPERLRKSRTNVDPVHTCRQRVRRAVRRRPCILVRRRAARRLGAAPSPPNPPARGQGVHEREAHLSAQEAQARPYARVPRTHEHPRGTPRPEAASRQGPQATHRRATRSPLVRDRAPRRRRLSRSAEFERVYRQGRSKGNRFLVLYAFPREDESRADDEGPRLGLSVSRRGRRRRRSQPRQARAARGVLGGGRAAARRLGLRRRRAPRRA